MSNILDRYHSLQFLRAFAAWLVVFHHYSQMYKAFETATTLERLVSIYGGLGVDIFFVLSGFIMALSMTQRPKSPGSFAWDRIVRIIPAYWVATGVLVITLQLPLWDSIKHHGVWSWKELIYSLLMIPNPDPASTRLITVLPVGWTLNFEMAFYALLALCLFVSRKNATYLAVGVLLILPILQLLGIARGPIIGSFLLYEFAFGLLIFQLVVQAGQIHQRTMTMQISLAFICFAIALYALMVGFYAWDKVIATALVLGCVCAEKSFRMLPKMAVALFVHLGDISYSTYLLHIPAIILVGSFVDRSGNNDAMLLVATIAVTYIVSMLSYVLVEQKLSKAIRPLFNGSNTRNPARS